MKTTRMTGAVVAATLSALALTGCGSSSDNGGTSAPAASSSGASQPATQASSLTIGDPWVKAARDGMTAAFGTLTNDGAEPITVTSATSSITSAMELHETVKNDDGTMAMQPKQGGFTIPAGGEHLLSPGGDHIMVMDLTRPVEPGERVTITLVLADGSTKDLEFTVKNFTGAEEKYQNGDDMQMEMP